MGRLTTRTDKRNQALSLLSATLVLMFIVLTMFPFDPRGITGGIIVVLAVHALIQLLRYVFYRR